MIRTVAAEDARPICTFCFTDVEAGCGFTAGMSLSDSVSWRTLSVCDECAGELRTKDGNNPPFRKATSPKGFRPGLVCASLVRRLRPLRLRFVGRSVNRRVGLLSPHFITRLSTTGEKQGGFMCGCVICGRAAIMTLGGFNFCGAHAQAARVERLRHWQLTFDDLHALHSSAAKDADGDAVFDCDPLIGRWVASKLSVAPS